MRSIKSGYKIKYRGERWTFRDMAHPAGIEPAASFYKPRTGFISQ
jgi:hypothetical protein